MRSPQFNQKVGYFASSHLTLLSTDDNLPRPSWGTCDHPSMQLVFQLNSLIPSCPFSLFAFRRCGSSTAASEPIASGAKTTTKSSPQEQAATKQMSSETSAVAGAPAAKAPAVKATTAKPAASKKTQAAPAPGVKNVRAAYSGKGW